MKNKFMRFLLSACAGISALVASAVVQVDIEHDTSGVRLGYWTSDFAAAKAYADENHVPFLGFWGSAGCGYCALMKSTGLISEEFTAWVEKNKIVMCYVEVPASQTSVMTPAKEFIKGSNKSGEYPFMTFYWNKADGSQVKVDFTGRKGDIPPYSKGTLGTQFVAGLNYYFGTYKPVDAYAGGYFAVTNLPNARLEAVVGLGSRKAGQEDARREREDEDVHAHADGGREGEDGRDRAQALHRGRQDGEVDERDQRGGRTGCFGEESEVGGRKLRLRRMDHGLRSGEEERRRRARELLGRAVVPLLRGR